MNRAGYHLAATALDSVVAALLAITLDVEAGVEITEAAVEPGPHAGVGVEND